MNKYKYPLQNDPFTLKDRLKICKYILFGDRLTMGNKVKTLEKKFSDYTCSKYTLATSSGSTANHLLVETFFQSHKYSPQDTIVFVPATTWASSVSPWIMKGCEVRFVDINLIDFCFNYEKLNQEISKTNKKIKVIFPTFLVGFLGNCSKLNQIKTKHLNTYLFVDLCECTLVPKGKLHPASFFDMCTTSTFFAHQINSIEGGMLFINDKDNSTYEHNAKMIRNHGLLRSLKGSKNINDIVRMVSETVFNPDIDPEFLFPVLGTNYRMSDLHAIFGILDFKRIENYISHRQKLWKNFISKLNINKYRTLNPDIVPFCLPIVKTKSNKKDLCKIKKFLNEKGWETRPIISFLPLNKAFKNDQNLENFPNSNYLHNNGFYVGLNNEMKIKDIEILIKHLEAF